MCPNIRCNVFRCKNLGSKHTLIYILSTDQFLYTYISGDKRQFLRESLVVMGQIGADDYDSWFSAGRPAENIEDIIPDVVTYISHFTEEFILENGAKPFLIPNISPMWCLASYLSRYRSDNPTDYDEHGCLRWLNEVSHKHNQELSDEVTRLRFYHPGEAHLRRLLRRRHGTCQESCQIR